MTGMKYLNKITKVLASFVLIISLGACSMFDLDINKNPNAPGAAALDLLLTNIETNMFSNIAGTEGDLETFMGMVGTQSLSRWDLNTNSYDGLWQSLYNTSVKDLESMIARATETNSSLYLGVAQTLKAYLFMTLVDLWGDVPFSQAAQGDASKAIKTPGYDKDAEIYAACLKLLDDAIANFAKTGASVSGDIIYGGNISRWLKAARSLKLKGLITARKGIADATTQINALITGGNLISAEAEDFKFTFSKDPTSIRHPWYTGAYTGGEFDYTYINNQLMLEMLYDFDPRYRYYFRHQTTVLLNFNDPTQRNTAPIPYIPLTPNVADTLKAKGYSQNFINGIFGRDRGDADGIPADGSLRTIPGVYPCGGFYLSDLASNTTVNPTANTATGGGIYPALTGVNVLYYQIEAILALGAAGDARALFKKAIEDHIARVVNFSVAADASSPSLTAITPARDAYVARWLARWDSATDNNGKLNVAMKQLWFSSFGNGFEIFNAFRRTGFPNTLAPLVDGTPKGGGAFVNRLPYALSELNLNKGMTDAQKNVKYWIDKVFWQK
jgi:hypothetical protein